MKSRSNNPRTGYKFFLYAFKLVWQGDKGYIIHTFIRNIYTAAFLAFLNIYVLKYILTCIEEQRPLTDLIFYVGIICAGHIVAHIVSAYHEYYIRNNAPLVTKSIFSKVMDVSSKTERIIKDVIKTKNNRRLFS